MRQKQRRVPLFDELFGKTADEELFQETSRLYPEDDEVGTAAIRCEQTFEDLFDRVLTGMPDDAIESVGAEEELGIAEKKIGLLLPEFGRYQDDLGLEDAGERHEVVERPRGGGRSVKGDEDTLDLREPGRGHGEDGGGGAVEEVLERFTAGAACLEMERGLQSGHDEVIKNGRAEEFLGGDALVFGLAMFDSGGFAGRGAAGEALAQSVVGVFYLPLHFLHHHRIVGTDRGDETGADLVGVEDGDGGDLGPVRLGDEAGGIGGGLGEYRGIEGEEDSSQGGLHDRLVSRIGEVLPRHDLCYIMHSLSSGRLGVAPGLFCRQG